MQTLHIHVFKFLFACLFVCFEKGSFYIVLAVLELTMSIRLISNLLAHGLELIAPPHTHTLEP